MENIKLTNKTIKSIFEIEKSKCMYDICKKTGTCYAYQVELFQKLEKQGFVTSRKVGRKRLFDLTDKGKKLKFYLEEIRKL